jgi:hypothetical protein
MYGSFSLRRYTGHGDEAHDEYQETLSETPDVHEDTPIPRETYEAPCWAAAGTSKHDVP